MNPNPGGFFTQLFEQFIALLSAFCIVPAPAPDRFEAFDAGTAGVVAEVAAPAIAEPREPLVVRVIQTQITGAISIGEALARSADDVTFSVLAVPRTLARALDVGGVEALPGGAATAAGGMVSALENGSTRLIEALSEAILAQLGLLGGDVGPAPKFAAAVEPAPGPIGTGSVELVVRLPLAVGVAGAGLLGTAAQATLIVTGAVVTAITDIAEAAIPAPPRPDETERVAALERPRLTLPQAIARAPVTISDGLTRAGGVVEEGIQTAQRDFERTLTGRSPEREVVRASGAGDNEVLATPVIAGDDTTTAARAEVTRPNRPRPVLGAVKPVTDTLKAVRDGVRTALGLPPRNPGPAAQNADDGVDGEVDAATGS
ncbi:MAG: hypothetical protein ACRDU5_16930 [Mycobacterium sp.]